MSEAQFLTGDALTMLRTLPDESSQTCVTSPPYWGLRDYGVAGQLGLESTPDEYVSRLVEIFREVRRVIAKDGTCWLNLGDSYCSVNGAQSQGENGQMANRSVVRARAQVRDGKAAAGMGAPQRPPSIAGLKPKDLVGIPWRVAFALQADGWWLRSDIVWAKPNPMPESVTDRPTKSHEYVFLMAKSERYYFDAKAISERMAELPHAPGNLASSDGGHLRKDFGTDRMGAVWGASGMRNARSVWTIATTPYPEAHFATFPEELARRCILAGSREGDLVLDPFAGSGTTGLVALKAARRFVGIELNPEYVAMAERRLDPYLRQARLAL